MEKITAEYARSILSYNPDDGEIRWLVRSDVPKNWNTKFAGKIAGSTDDKGYRQIKIHRVLFKAHRLAWLITTGEWPKEFIDHANGKTGDNRFCNLRLASNAENQFNRQKTSKNSSGFKGVSWNARDGIWQAGIKINGISKNLGQFKTPELGHAAYCEAAKRIFGRFANMGKFT